MNSVSMVGVRSLTLAGKAGVTRGGGGGCLEVSNNGISFMWHLH
jgi:hypothetical protein